MKSIINELWHGNIIPQEDSRTNSPQMKELLGYMSRNYTASFAFSMYSFNHFKKLQCFDKRLESIVAKRKCL